MSTPLAAGFRYELNYVVDTVPHKAHIYLKAVIGSGSSGYDLVLRDSVSGVDARQLANGWWTAMDSSFEAAKTQIGSAVLQAKVGSVWQPLDTFTPAITLTGSGNYNKAAQFTLSLRDTGYHMIRCILLESAWGAGQHGGARPTVSNGIKTIVDWYLNVPAAGSATGYNAIVGRSNLYPKSFVAWTTDLNNKTRRTRHIM